MLPHAASSLLAVSFWLDRLGAQLESLSDQDVQQVSIALDDITDPAAVQGALEEFKGIGKIEFLKRYGFEASRGWMLQQDGAEYDAKAILGAAHQYPFSSLGPLPQSEFHGGAPTARKLRNLGFTVSEPVAAERNPPWSRDELILALDLYMRCRPIFPGDDHPDVVALSGLLNRLAFLTDAVGNTKSRNGNGVALKLQNLRFLDPNESGRGLSGGGKKTEPEVWNTFANDPERLRSAAAAIEASVLGSENTVEQKDDDGEEAEEGKILTRLHHSRERNRKIVERRKAKALRDHGSLQCEACGFDFLSRYGERGSGFIECHHTKPVSGLLPGEKTRLDELALLCSNCHRIIHVRRPWITVEELRTALSA